LGSFTLRVLEQDVQGNFASIALDTFSHLEQVILGVLTCPYSPMVSHFSQSSLLVTA